jgi:sugar phosphate isomerase/epimerase
MKSDHSLTRREAIRLLASIAAATTYAVENVAQASGPSKTRLGLVIYTQNLRRRALKVSDPKHDLFEPMPFLEHCRDLGAGGMQVPLGVLEPAICNRLRERAAAYGMFIEGIVAPPFTDADIERFRAEIETASRVGTRAVRTVIIPGRRYERFRTRGEFEEFVQRGRQALKRAKPIVERHQVRLAVENHKDQRLDERLELLQAIDSPFVGACVDTGNSLALLEDPLSVVQALAPYAYSVHLKDQAVQQCADGFLLADVALGDGFLPLKRMVDILRQAQPEVQFSLETITRDPLRVPCLAETYWPTFPDVPASDLAQTLGLIRTHTSDRLVSIGRLPLVEQAAIERETVVKSLDHARTHLQL